MTLITTIVGARPQFVKAAVLLRALRGNGARESLIHTGQHYDASMSGIFFEEFGMRKPDYELAIGSGQHGAQTGRMIEGIEKALLEQKPDWVVVLGDTNSTLAGAIAAAKLNIPVAHVEAGLRSFNRKMPEEVNRILTDHASTALFVPTETGRKNLLNEGVADKQIVLSGDVMLDAVLFYRELAEKNSTALETFNLRSKQYALATIHRAENTDDPERLRIIMEAFSKLSENYQIIFPVHPRTRAAIQRLEAAVPLGPNLQLVEPLGYLDMLQLESNAGIIFTDSGGVQKEALFLNVPCMVLRDQTEWVENLDSGISFLVPPVSVDRLVSSAERTWKARAKGELLSQFGSGTASDKIAKSLLGWR